MKRLTLHCIAFSFHCFIALDAQLWSQESLVLECAVNAFKYCFFPSKVDEAIILNFYKDKCKLKIQAKYV